MPKSSLIERWKTSEKFVKDLEGLLNMERSVSMKRDCIERFATFPTSEPATNACPVESVLQNTPSPFGLIDGRQDLRGFSFEGIKSIKKIKFADIDLAMTTLSKCRLEACEFKNVVFGNANLTLLNDQSNLFEGCRFDKTNFANACLGGQGSRFVRCGFFRVDFTRKTTFIRGEFDDCIFDDCRFSGVDFFASSFLGCKFIGIVKDAWFRGTYPGVPDKPELRDGFVKEFGNARPNQMKDVDFSEAELRGLTFSDGCHLGECLLPKAQKHLHRFSLWKQVLTAVKERLPFAFSEPEQPLRLVSCFDSHAGSQEWYILDFEFFLNNLGNEGMLNLEDIFLDVGTRLNALHP